MEHDGNDKFRHDFKTFLNHIVGYGEILREDARELGMADLSGVFGLIHETALSIRNTADAFFRTKPMENRHGLDGFRTTMIGLVERVRSDIESARKKLEEEDGKAQFLPDIEQMADSASRMLALFEEYHARIVSAPPDTVQSPEGARAKFEDSKSRFPGRILIVDDDKVNRDLMARFIGRQGHTVCTSDNGRDALLMMTKVHFDLVILDVMMPSFDGYMVLGLIKEDPHLQDTPVIVISSLEDSRAMARCIELGAEDYLPREFDPIILKARIDASLEKRRIKAQREVAIRAIVNSQERLRHELKGAADYVHSLLPEPFSRSGLEADWVFIPSLSLGGDIFDYFFVDDSTFAFYLLDVSGHGIEAALVSVSIMNMLKAETLADADFRDPASVLSALNATFKIEEQNNLYFTIWYGVYDLKTRTLRYASGGSTPALLFARPGAPERLSVAGTIIGIDPDSEYRTESVVIPKGTTLFLFSDGVFEVKTRAGGMLGLDGFASIAGETACSSCDVHTMLRTVMHGVRAASEKGEFADDVSFIGIRFS